MQCTETVPLDGLLIEPMSTRRMTMERLPIVGKITPMLSQREATLGASAEIGWT
jgi:hypothetical protein